MRIAIVLNTSWNIYNFRLSLIKALQKQGHEVHTIAPKDDFTPLLEAQGCIHHNLKMDSRGANPVKDLALVAELYRLYKRLRPDVILHFTIKPNIYGTLAAAALGIPSVNNVCGLGTAFLKKGLTAKIAMLLYRLSFRFAHKVFFQNPEDLKLFEDNRIIDVRQADLVPGSGINLEHFAPAPRQTGKPFTFLMISRLITDKGVLEYIQAIELLKRQGLHARYQLLGAIDEKHKRGIPAKTLAQWVEAGTVEYLGTTADVRKCIEQADCVVLPSYREGTPRTLLEASAMKRPVIATDVPGCRQVVEHNKTGLLCQQKDAHDLAAKMHLMASMPPETLEAWGEKARQKVENEFDEKLVISKYLQTLNTLTQLRTSCK
jgi:glycosyltransferase involved in cell wall biosynthesis